MTEGRLQRVPELRRRVLQVHRPVRPVHHRARRVRRGVANRVGITITAAGATTVAVAGMTRAAVLRIVAVAMTALTGYVGGGTATGARTVAIARLIVIYPSQPTRVTQNANTTPIAAPASEKL